LFALYKRSNDVADQPVSKPTFQADLFHFLPFQVAVKSLKLDSKQGEEEFRSEIGLIAQNLRNPHLVRLLGYCTEGGSRMLVYELMRRGDLRLEPKLFPSQSLSQNCLLIQRFSLLLRCFRMSLKALIGLSGSLVEAWICSRFNHLASHNVSICCQGILL
jgi:serine/threonine protein kinase